MTDIVNKTTRSIAQIGLALAAGSTAVSCSPDIVVTVHDDDYTLDDTSVARFAMGSADPLGRVNLTTGFQVNTFIFRSGAGDTDLGIKDLKMRTFRFAAKTAPHSTNLLNGNFALEHQASDLLSVIIQAEEMRTWFSAVGFTPVPVEEGVDPTGRVPTSGLSKDIYIITSLPLLHNGRVSTQAQAAFARVVLHGAEAGVFHLERGALSVGCIIHASDLELTKQTDPAPPVDPAIVYDERLHFWISCSFFDRDDLRANYPGTTTKSAPRP